VKDLRSRLLALAVLAVSLGTLVGCATLQGDSRQYSGNNALIVVTPQLDFGAVVVGRSKTLNATLLNRTAFGVRITDATIGNPQFQIVSPAIPFSIRPGQAVSLQIQYTPQSAGSATATAAVATTAPQNSATFNLTAQGVVAGTLTPSAPSISFSSTAVGQSTTKPEVFTNTGSTSVTVSQLNVTGADFQISGVTLPFTLDAGKSQAFNVIYTPKAAGTSTGSIAVNSNVAMSVNSNSRFRVRTNDMEAQNMTIALSGTASGGAGAVTASPASVTFGNVQINGTSSSTVTLRNTGTTSISVNQAAVTGTGFTMTGMSIPATIAGGQTASFSVTFAPKAAGSVTGNVAITSTASNASFNVALSGTGVTPGSLSTGSNIMAFGTVQVGKNQKQTATITNNGGSSVTISSATINGAGFALSGISTPLTLTAGQSTTFSVTYTPTSSANASGTVTVASNAPGSPMTWTLSGSGVTAGSLTANPSSLSFGTIQTTTNKSIQETLTNSGGTTVHISALSATGAYSVTGATLPITLAAGASTSFNVLFAPTTSGAANSSLTVTSDASNPSLAIPLTGTGAAAGSLSAGTSPLSFGAVTVGQNKTLSETITNNGGMPVTVSQAAATGTGYSVSGVTLPFTLAAGASKSFNVVFAPAAAGSPTGTLTVTSDASNPSLTVSLSGTAATVGTLAATTSPLSFSNVTVNQTKTLSETVTNNGGSSVTVSQVSATGTGYSVSGVTVPFTLAAGASKSFNVVFAPTAAGSPTGTLTVTSNASNPSLTVSLSGSAATVGTLAATTSPLSFGNVTVNQNKTLSETITNNGGSTVTVSQVSATGTGYSVSGVTVPFTLAAGASKSFNVVFAPTTSGSPTGTLTVTSDASNPSLTVSLSGTAASVGALAATTTPLSFGNVTVNQNKTLSETITNNGGSTVTVSQVSATGTGFSVSGVTVPFTLAAGSTKSFNVVFAPTTSGTPTGTLTVTSDASNPSLTVSLSGTATSVGTLAATTSPLSFGSVTVNQNKTLSETITNNGGATVTVSQVSASGTGFSVSGITVPFTLTAGATKSFNVVFAPTTSGTPTGTLTVTSDASDPSLTVSLSGTAASQGTISANPTSLSFGSVQVGNSSSKSEVLSNTGGSAITVSQVTVSGTGYGISGVNVPFTINAGQSFTFSVSFTPQAAGTPTGSVSVVSNASNTLPAITLSGTGTAVGTFGVAPSSFGFGSVIVGQTKNMTATLTATSASVTVTSASVSSAEFQLTGPALPLTIASGQSATFTLTFRPQATGSAAATVSFVTNAVGSPLSENLTGTGTAAPQHQVSLSWAASTSTVSGYNVYRSTTSGSGYTKLNSSVNVSTAYTDNSVVAGSTYFYVTTAVDSSGNESSYSNQVQAVIPTP
jgi:hypothetical protein